jgi:hypothetical protein
MGLIPGRVKPNRVFIEIPEAHNIKELDLLTRSWKYVRMEWWYV